MKAIEMAPKVCVITDESTDQTGKDLKSFSGQ